MILSEALGEIKTIFLDTAPVIYFIEAHDQFGPLIKQVVELMNENRIQAFTSVLTLSEVLPKPVETERKWRQIYFFPGSSPSPEFHPSFNFLLT